MSLFVCTFFGCCSTHYTTEADKSQKEKLKNSGEEVFWRPEMSLHIHMTIGFEGDALLLQERTVLAPSWCCAPLAVHHTMTRQLLGSRRIAEGATHHPCMTGPTRQGGDETICRHIPTGYLADDIQHIGLEGACLLCCHLAEIVLHRCFSGFQYDKGTAFLLKRQKIQVFSIFFLSFLKRIAK